VTPRRRARAADRARELPTLFEAEGEREDGHGMTSIERDPSILADPGGRPATAISVATLAAATRDIVEGAIPPLWVRGEVIEFKRHRRGHWYFTLKDDVAQIRCVIWASDARRLNAAPDEGMAVVARGQLTVYTARSDLQFRVFALEGVGDGLWRKAFEETRQRLDADGLLAPERKRRLPPFPRCVAVITSTDGAALRDVIAVVRRRCPVTEIVAVHAVVQGDEAPGSLRAAFRRVARWGKADVVIVGRGGGGRDDLRAFNDEGVARALAACPVPTIAAIGHEVDVTLCDLVADWRAPTPSAAGESAVPVLAELRRTVHAQAAALLLATENVFVGARRRTREAARAAIDRADRAAQDRRRALEQLSGRLQGLSPLSTMARGFAAVSDVEGRPIRSASALTTGDPFRVRFRDGRVAARVESVARDALEEAQ
jgi:exodeoxyribonuclease VII large subunit